jgi:hypothetical protein
LIDIAFIATVIAPLQQGMEPVYKTKLTVSFAVDLEVEYNSFGGKTVDEIAEALQDDLDDLLFELPHVEGVYTTLTNLGFND